MKQIDTVILQVFVCLLISGGLHVGIEVPIVIVVCSHNILIRFGL